MEEFLLNSNIGIAGLIISALGLMQVLISPHFEQWAKKLFIAFFSIMVAIAVFNLTGQVMSIYSDLTHARGFRFSLFWESLLPSLLMLLLTVFFAPVKRRDGLERKPTFSHCCSALDYICRVVDLYAVFHRDLQHRRQQCVSARTFVSSAACSSGTYYGGQCHRSLAQEKEIVLKTASRIWYLHHHPHDFHAAPDVLLWDLHDFARFLCSSGIHVQLHLA